MNGGIMRVFGGKLSEFSGNRAGNCGKIELVSGISKRRGSASISLLKRDFAEWIGWTAGKVYGFAEMSASLAEFQNDFAEIMM